MTLPRPIQMLLCALGGVVLLSGLLGVYLTFTQTPPAWFFFSFELVVVLASGFLIALGAGKVRQGPALTLLCCAGAVGAGSLLGGKATGQQIAGHSVTWLVAFRAGAAAVMLLAAAAELALRDPRRTLPRIGWGVALAVPLVGLLGLYATGRLQTTLGTVGANSPVLAFGLWLLIGVIACALAAASGHLLITGFALGVDAWDRRGVQASPPAGPAAAKPATASAPSGTPSGAQG